jgi:hypothetical protein
MKTKLIALLAFTCVGVLPLASAAWHGGSTAAAVDNSDELRIRVACAIQNRVDQQWDMTVCVDVGTESDCCVYIVIPKDSTATTIANTLRDALMNVCDVDAGAVESSGGGAGGGTDATFKLKNAKVKKVTTRKYQRRKKRCKNCKNTVHWFNPTPQKDHLKVYKGDSNQPYNSPLPDDGPVNGVRIEIASSTIDRLAVSLELETQLADGTTLLKSYERVFPSGTSLEAAVRAMAAWATSQGFVVEYDSDQTPKEVVIRPDQQAMMTAAWFSVWGDYEWNPIPEEDEHQPYPHQYEYEELSPGEPQPAPILFKADWRFEVL